MWFFRKKKDPQEIEAEEEAKKVTHKLDRIIMGMIIGSAIGSVVGMSLAPKKGKETRKYLKHQGIKAMDFIQEVRHEIRKNLEKTPEKQHGFFTELLHILVGKKK